MVTEPSQLEPSSCRCSTMSPHRSVDAPSYCGFRSGSGSQPTHRTVTPLPRSIDLLATLEIETDEGLLVFERPPDLIVVGLHYSVPADLDEGGGRRREGDR